MDEIRELILETREILMELSLMLLKEDAGINLDFNESVDMLLQIQTHLSFCFRVFTRLAQCDKLGQ